MSTPAEFYFNDQHVASKYQDGYMAGALWPLLGFLRRDGYETVCRVFEDVPEFRILDDETPEFSDERRPDYKLIPGYGWAELDVDHCMLEGDYKYFVSPSGSITAYDYEDEIILAIPDWNDPGVYSALADVISARCMEGSEPPYIDDLRTYDDSGAVRPGWLDAYDAGVPLSDIVA